MSVASLIPWGEILTRLTTLAINVSAIVAATGACIKFAAWQKDRMLVARLDSALSLREIGLTTALRALGERECMRLHFLRLTTLDETNDYDALIAYNQQLGGTEQDWRRMQSARPFLRVFDGVVNVDEVDQRPRWHAPLAWTLFWLFAAASVVLLVAGLISGPLAPIDQLNIVRVLRSALMCVYAVVPALFAVLAWQYANALTNALGLKRRWQKVQASSQAADRLLLFSEPAPPRTDLASTTDSS